MKPGTGGYLFTQPTTREDARVRRAGQHDRRDHTVQANEAGAALNQTVGQLQGGVLRLGIESAIPAIAGWEQTLSASGVPELQPKAENLGVLRESLAADSFDPAEVGGLLTALAEQVRVVTTTPYGLPIAAPLTQLSLLLNTAGASLASQETT
jgi:hypothetical protein